MAFKREAVIKIAEKHVSKGKIDAAIKEYRKILQKAPNDISSLNRVGDLYARIEKIDDAVGLFGQIADQYTDDGFFPKAIAIYKKILKLDPRRFDAYQSLAELYQKQGLTNDARAQYQVLAAYYQKHGELDKAIGVCQKMSELEPDNPSHHVKLADLYRESGQTSEALEAYSRIASLMMGHGHVGEAAQVYHRALDLGASQLDFVRRAVTSLKDAGDIDAAVKLVIAAGEINPAAKGLAGQIGLSEAVPVAPPEPPIAEAVPIAPPPVRPPVAAPEPAPEFELSDSFVGLEETPSMQVRPPSDLDEAPAIHDEAIDIGGGLGLESDIPLEIDWSEMQSLEEESDELVEASAASVLETQPAPPDLVPPALVKGPPLRKTEDLLAEAEVFSKYGLAQKALDRFQEILDQDPDCLEAHRMRLGLLLQQEDRPAIDEAAQRMQEAAERLGEAGEWEQMRSRLVEEGFLAGPETPSKERKIELELDEPDFEPLEAIAIANDEVVAIEEPVALEPEPAVEWVEEIEPEIEMVFDEIPIELEEELPELELPELELVADSEAGEDEEAEDRAIELPAPVPAPAFIPSVPPPSELNLDEAAPTDIRDKRPKAFRGIDAALAEITASILQPMRKTRRKKLAEPVFELDSPPEIEISPPISQSPEPIPVELAAGPESLEQPDLSIADALDESGMDWLDEVAASGTESEAASEKLFDDEDDFFDLAAELQDELGSDDELAVIGEPEEQSLAEIVEGFKKGVSEALSEEDVDTHYNLGIAYREMGLVDEAIGEFQLAAKDPGYLVNCCAMLGVCFVEKGLPELAVKWYRRALEHPNLREEEYLGLMYDLGAAQASMGEHTAAHETFVEIYGVKSNYRDVSDKMQEAASAAGA